MPHSRTVLIFLFASLNYFQKPVQEVVAQQPVISAAVWCNVSQQAFKVTLFACAGHAQVLLWSGSMFSMSTHRLPLWPCLHALMGYVVIILTSLPDFSEGQNCSHPIIPEHGGFYCKPSPCRGFPPKSRIYYFCNLGYILPNHIHHSNCRKGRWDPSIPKCIPNTAGHAKHEDRLASSVPSVATTAVGVSIFLLTATACMVLKSQLCSCHSHGRRLPVSLPTYEEAVHGSRGQCIPPLCGPTLLLLASSENSPISPLIQSGSSNCRNTSNPSTAEPPPYDDTPPRPVDGGREGEARDFFALTVGKDN